MGDGGTIQNSVTTSYYFTSNKPVFSKKKKKVLCIVCGWYSLDMA
jgi:hypothetical protein